MVKLNINTIKGLTKPEEELFRELVSIFNQHQEANNIKTRYYEGHIPLSEVNLGIALPSGFQNLKIDCNWGSKAVDVLASRSMFDGFVYVVEWLYRWPWHFYCKPLPQWAVKAQAVHIVVGCKS